MQRSRIEAGFALVEGARLTRSQRAAALSACQNYTRCYAILETSLMKPVGRRDPATADLHGSITDDFARLDDEHFDAVLWGRHSPTASHAQPG